MVQVKPTKWSLILQNTSICVWLFLVYHPIYIFLLPCSPTTVSYRHSVMQMGHQSTVDTATGPISRESVSPSKVRKKKKMMTWKKGRGWVEEGTRQSEWRKWNRVTKKKKKRGTFTNVGSERENVWVCARERER